MRGWSSMTVLFRRAMAAVCTQLQTKGETTCEKVIWVFDSRTSSWSTTHQSSVNKIIIFFWITGEDTFICRLIVLNAHLYWLDQRLFRSWNTLCLSTLYFTFSLLESVYSKISHISIAGWVQSLLCTWLEYKWKFCHYVEPSKLKRN